MAGLPEPSVQGTTSAKGQTTAVELSRAQQTIARRMAESKATIPHLTLQIDVSMDDCLTLQAELQTVTHSDMIVKACALALREHPIANGRYRDGRLQLHSRVNVGFTVTSPGTLLVPTVFDADQKSLPEIAGERSALAERAHAGTISPSELSGATFTVSDLGSHGVRSFAAVIIPPQVAILSIGAVEPRVVSSRSPSPATTAFSTVPTPHSSWRASVSCSKHPQRWQCDGARRPAVTLSHLPYP
jgi:pyruvate dehydrogenase E2 component (dihydrolipoamide acetyltransferase)